MLSSISRHFFALTIGLGTALALLVITTRASFDAPLVQQQSGVYVSIVQIIYLFLLASALVLWRTENTLRLRLQTRPLNQILVVLSGVIACLLVSLLPPDQGVRLFTMPFSLWVIIIHGVGLCVLVAVFVIKSLFEAPDSQTTKAASLVLLLFSTLLLILHIASVGRYMQLDLPDEPWLTSPAANYALTGQFTSPQLAWTYGITDPVLQRFYLAMGMWLKAVGSTSLLALRSFSLLVAGGALLVFALMLWRFKSLNMVQKLAGLATMLGFSVFVRTSHNLRADVMLALYGALLLWGLLRWFERPVRGNLHWLILMGLALFIGMEGVPTVALIVTALVAGFLCFGDRPAGNDPNTTGYWNWQTRFQALPLAVFGAACGVSLLAYGAIRFLPDVGEGLKHYEQFVKYYVDIGLIGFRLPLDVLFNYNLRFDLILSPAEGVVLSIAFVLLWRHGSRAERRVVALVLLAVLAIMSLVTASYGYWALLTPFAAYAVARALRNRLTVMVGAFVLLPALLVAPIHDLATAVQNDPNQPLLDGADLMTGQFPAGTRIVGDELFWFTLHSEHTFIGWWGFDRYNDINNLSLWDGLLKLSIDVVICNESDTARFNDLIETNLFQTPTEFFIKRKGYWLFWRKA